MTPFLMKGGEVWAYHGATITKHPQCSRPCPTIEHSPAREDRTVPSQNMYHIQVHVQVLHTPCSTHVYTAHISALTCTYICAHLPHMVRMHSPHVRVYSMYVLNVLYTSTHDTYT